MELATPIGIDPDVFRAIAGHFATGVTVITAEHGGERVGSTASAFCSLSLAPPMVLVCLNGSSRSSPVIDAAGGFAVSILHHEQLPLARHFARPAADKFAGIALLPGPGHPVLAGALAHLRCRVTERIQGGTHTVFLAEVVAGATGDGEPLAYFRGRFGRFVESA